MLTALAMGCAGSAGAQVERRVAVGLLPSLLQVEALGASGRVQLGSGVAVGPHEVVTNCHVTRDATRMRVVQGGVGAEVDGQVADPRRDLCLLRVAGPALKPVPLGRSAALREGQDVVALGYTGGGMQIAAGQVIALHRWDGGQVVQASTGFTSGASGGGLFDADGALVGVLTFRLPGAAGHYYAAPAEWLQPLLAAPAPAFAPVAPFAGRAYWEQPAAALPPFLRAAPLERERRWPELAELAEHWQHDDEADPEPPYLLALACEGLGRTDAAISAWNRSAALAPTSTRSWVRLVRLYHRLGRSPEQRRALAALAGVDPSVARDVANELERPVAPPEPVQ